MAISELTIHLSQKDTLTVTHNAALTSKWISLTIYQGSTAVQEVTVFYDRNDQLDALLQPPAQGDTPRD